MRKIGVSAIMFAFGILMFANSVSANEGRFTLKNANVTCEGLSIWKDDQYRVTGRCNGLTYPYQARRNQYVLWSKLGTEAPKRMGIIDAGYFNARSATNFDQVFVSVEEDSSPRVPGDIIIASGNLVAFDFSPLATNSNIVVITPKATPTPTKAQVSSEVNAAKLSRGLKQGAAIVAVILGVGIAAAIAMLIVRRNG